MKKFPPDWKDHSAYPDPGNTSPEQWAWEFKRRNSDYQKDYDLLKQVESDNSMAITTPYGFGKWAYIPPPVPQENLEQYRDRMLKTHGGGNEVLPLEKYLTEKWGLWGEMVDLQKNYSKEVRICGVTHVRIIGQKSEFDNFGDPDFPYDISGCFEKENEVLLAFDLDQPISKLIDDAKSFLEMLQDDIKSKPKTKRVQKELYSIYLRVFDGKEAGAALKEMARIIYPKIKNEHPDFNGNQRIKDNIEAAEKLCRASIFQPTPRSPKK